MYRILIFLAGTIIGYLASGYIEGLTEEENPDSAEKAATPASQATEVA